MNKASPAATAPADSPAVRKAYRAGMRKGRKATDAKRYEEAIAGFDAALVAKPGDPRALGERGFARLREGSDLEAAWRDLDAAAGATKDPKLLSQVWFNRGLIEEMRGNVDNAHAAFATANELRPTAAAKAKLENANACPASIDRAFSVWETPVISAASWKELATTAGLDEDGRPDTQEALFEALTGSPREPSLPAIISVISIGVHVDYAVWRSGKTLHAVPVGMAQRGRCPGSLSFKVVASERGLVHVHGSETDEGGYTFMCNDKRGELVECAGDEDEDSAGTACMGGSATLRDVVIDTASSKAILAVDQLEPKAGAPVGAALVDDGLALSGRGCDRVVPLQK